jgi:hypothetical protein
MIVQPTKEDVEYAESQSRWACVVVRAIQRQIPDSLRVRVDKETVAYTSHGHRYYHPTPPEMVEDIIKPFDEHRLNDVVLGEYPLIVAEIKPERKMSTEVKKRLREHERIRTKKRQGNPATKSHDRFCEVN